MKYLLIGMLTIIIWGCSSQHAPAPIVELNTSIPASKASYEITGKTYEVKQGDTLFSIAFYSGNAYLDLAQINELSPPYRIFPGQTLKLVKKYTKNNPIENNTVPTKVGKKSLASVDHKKNEAYGDPNSKFHRKKSTIRSNFSSNVNYSKTYSWIWPASGNTSTAVVGTDGTVRGIDIMGERNSPIVAAASGKVVYAGNALKGYGNLVIIKHDDDYLSAYAHNEKILVDEQSIISQGQIIATMGRSGTNLDRLHFEIRKRGRSVNPLKYLPKR